MIVSMKPKDTFSERAVRFVRADFHYSMVVAPDGRFLGADGGGALTLSDEISDDLMWRFDEGRLRHGVVSVSLDLEDGAAGWRLAKGGVKPDGVRGPFTVIHGPERLPSEYLDHLREHGWVCLAAVLAPEIVDGLQRIAGTDGYVGHRQDRKRRQLCQGSALAKTAVEPISVWLARSYLRTSDIRLAHSPGVGVLTPDDGKRTVQGWHSDYPYHWGINAAGKVPSPSGQTSMGVQRIVCVSEFTKFHGATAFKLGSHAFGHGPPEDWGLAKDAYRPDYRAANGLPYNGPDADVIEAPAGSMIVFDTRTWHRAGVNRSERGRAAILMDMTPAYIVPYSDTSEDYRAFTESDGYDDLNDREKAEFTRLMVHRFLGPAGPRSVIGTNTELTEQLPSP